MTLICMCISVYIPQRTDSVLPISLQEWIQILIATTKSPTPDLGSGPCRLAMAVLFFGSMPVRRSPPLGPTLGT